MEAFKFCYFARKKNIFNFLLETACRLYSDLVARWNYLITGRLSGGSLAEVGEFPWMVFDN